ncbi:MAG TPA: glycosyltransferase family 4 protein [Candidatus Sulfotelmatobacter sp.]|nr:glycosyltransferase family 4 protein [Candidatus Sulfotelmatobacter sp.]
MPELDKTRDVSFSGQQTEIPPNSRSRPTPVCIIVENLPVPVDRRVWCEARTLRDAGYVVSVICPKGKKAFTAGYEILDGIHVYRHGAWEASTKIGYLLEYILALAAELYLTLKVFARTRFQVLHACNPPDTIFLLGLVLRPFGVRFIFDHHDLSPELVEAKFGKRNGIFCALARLAEWCSFRAADVSIATNESFKEVAVARGGKRPEQVFVVRNCPDLTALRRAPARPEVKLGKPLLVVYVGFMGQQDGLDLLLGSIEHIVKRENRQDTNFVLVGGGTMLPALRAMVTEKGLDTFVTFTGQVPHEEVITYLSNADVGVAPDPKTPMNDNSTMIKIFEYMAFGLPTVLFDLKEGRRTAGHAALYASPNDPIDFANQISKLLNCGKMRQQLGACGRKRIEESLNWETEKIALLEAYSAALHAN